MSSIGVNAYKWVDSKVPTGLEVRQVYGFIFSPDDRILLSKDNGKYNLPDGRPENSESFAETLIRAADEEFAQVRLVALVDEIQQAPPTPALDGNTGDYGFHPLIQMNYSNGEGRAMNR